MPETLRFDDKIKVIFDGEVDFNQGVNITQKLIFDGDIDNVFIDTEYGIISLKQYITITALYIGLLI